MTKEQKIEIWAEIVAMPEKTKAEKLRKANAIRHFENADNDSGAYGRIREILSKSLHSEQVNFAKQGKADCFVWVDGKRYTAECKTNGGRIGSLYGKKAPKFVVYSMDICNAGTSNIRREIKQMIHPRSVSTVKFEAKRLEEQTISSVGTCLAVYLMCFAVIFLLVSNNI